ncbi:MAG: redoxin domain-containing protein [Clostridia bacterium]|nr:redoxin domain-containing protein [Clostridia bacterium]
MIKRIINLFLVFSLLFGVAGCTLQSASEREYKITVITEGGMPFSSVPVIVYSGTDKNDLVWRAETDSQGSITFTAKVSDDYIAVVEDIPQGYDNKEYYSVESYETVITPEILLEEKVDLTGISYDLGDIIHDFTVCDAEGNEHKLSDILKDKKMVMLNFWYLNCMPCKMEFPYLEEAYQQYNDKLEVIALNPVDGTNATVSAFADEMGLSFPMSVCDPIWESAMQLSAYPTTVIIDRYGMIGMIHKGYITETDTFNDIFEYFTSDGYVQSTVKNISDISQKEGE